jgi:hypothetical protein
MMTSKTLISPDAKLRAALNQRGETASAVGLRDLNRYYALLNYHLLEILLTADEASLICVALQDYQLETDAEQARGIWQRIAAVMQLDQHNQKWRVHREALMDKLQGLSHLQAVALVDAVERYWVRVKANPDESLETRLLGVDLIKCCDFAL